MKTIFEFVKALGYLGAIAAGLLFYYAISVQGLKAKDLLEGHLDAHELSKMWPVFVAIALFLGQFASNRRHSKLEIRHFSERADEAVATANKAIAAAGDEAIAAAKDDKNFWATLDAYLRDHRALMDHDEPNYVSAVTDSAFRLRESITKTLEKYPGVSGPMRNYAMLLRDEIKDFLDQVEKVERRAGITLKGAGVDRWQLASLCQGREGTSSNGSIPCDTAFEKAHSTWRTNTQTLAHTAAKLFKLPPPDFGTPSG
ncbi:hypothetical protein [Bradyrhizobium oligotrophicum]|uniref:hypothetical protein n=1 Tax=Bradyrhizobium oligotrophicum TaxID=44255 RepID=UPI003EC01226